MTAVGPVCHIAPETTIDQPGPVNLPSIPPAQANLQSLVNTVNQMRQVINYLTGRQGPGGPQAQLRTGTTNNATSKPSKPARWTENSRVIDTERVYQNNDNTSSNYVDVQRIKQLVMKDGVTGESWSWDRDRK